jgi:acyl dehydratase
VSVVGETNPIYYDADYARSLGYRGQVVPPIFVVILFRRIQDPEGGDMDRFGIDWPGFVLPPSHRNTRNAGQVYHWLRPVYVGDRLTVQVRFKDVFVKRGRRGVPVIYVQSEVEIRNQHDEVVVRQVNTDAKVPVGAAAAG